MSSALLLGHRALEQVGVEHRLTDRDAGLIRGFEQRRQRLLTDRTARDVDDAAERDRVGRVDDVTEVGQHVLDLGARVEADAADDPVGDALGEEAFFEIARLRVRAVQHQEVAVGGTLADVLLDLLHHVAHFGALGLGLERGELLALGTLGEERLGMPALVVRDQLVRRFEDRLRRAVVLFELEDRRAGEVFLEAQDHAVVAAAPRVDRLVVVADDGNVAVLLGQRRHQTVLGVVHVLVLVDQNVLELGLIARARVFVVVEQPDRAGDQVVEVESVGFGQAAVVLAVDVGVALAGEGRVLGLVLFGGPKVVLGLRDLGEGRARGDLALVVIEVGDHLADDPFLVGIVHDREVRRDADLLAVAPEHPDAHAMERADPQVARRSTDHPFEPRLHLAGRLVGERHRQDTVGEDLLLFEEVRDPVGEYTGLAGTGTREDQHRSVGMLDGLALDVVEEFGLRQHHVKVRHVPYFGLLAYARTAAGMKRRMKATNVGA